MTEATNGTRMLKLVRIRSLIGFMAVLAVAAGIFGMQDRLAIWWASGRSWWNTAQEEPDWRQQELFFLKGIYDRLERQRQAERGDAPASLRREQEVILRRIAETAKPIRDKVPPEIRSLLPDASVADAGKPASGAPAPPATAAPDVASAPPMPAPAAATAPATPPSVGPPLPEVRIEPANLPWIEVDLSALSRAHALDRPAERIVKLREPRPAKSADPKPSDSKSAEAKPAEAKSGEAKPQVKLGETKPAKAKPAKPKPAAAAPETGGSAKE
ncbi:MAG TPA: hypothetical protein VF007_06015 [Stellaceae bacterium]